MQKCKEEWQTVVQTRVNLLTCLGLRLVERFASSWVASLVPIPVIVIEFDTALCRTSLAGWGELQGLWFVLQYTIMSTCIISAALPGKVTPRHLTMLKRVVILGPSEQHHTHLVVTLFMI